MGLNCELSAELDDAYAKITQLEAANKGVCVELEGLRTQQGEARQQFDSVNAEADELDAQLQEVSHDYEASQAELARERNTCARYKRDLEFFMQTMGQGVAQIQAQHQQALADQQDQHAQAIADLQAQHAQEVSALGELCVQKITELIAEHQATIDRVVEERGFAEKMALEWKAKCEEAQADAVQNAADWEAAYNACREGWTKAENSRIAYGKESADCRRAVHVANSQLQKEQAKVQELTERVGQQEQQFAAQHAQLHSMREVILQQDRKYAQLQSLQWLATQQGQKIEVLQKQLQAQDGVAAQIDGMVHGLLGDE